MNTETVPQPVLFPDLVDRPLVATLDQEQATSDGGAVLLKAAERQYGLLDGFAECLVDDRQPGKVRHPLGDLLGQRVFGIACGHPDGNDADRLADDPIHKLLLGRDPVTGEALASQPTVSRFEHHVGREALYALGCELATSVLARHHRRRHGRARRITIDLDPTEAPTHGDQQLTFFNGYYDSWCYLPLLAFLTFDDEAEQYLSAAVLRPGEGPPSPPARASLSPGERVAGLVIPPCKVSFGLCLNAIFYRALGASMPPTRMSTEPDPVPWTLPHRIQNLVGRHGFQERAVPRVSYHHAFLRHPTCLVEPALTEGGVRPNMPHQIQRMRHRCPDREHRVSPHHVKTSFGETPKQHAGICVDNSHRVARVSQPFVGHQREGWLQLDARYRHSRQQGHERRVRAQSQGAVQDPVALGQVHRAYQWVCPPGFHARVKQSRMPVKVPAGGLQAQSGAADLQHGRVPVNGCPLFELETRQFRDGDGAT